MIRSHIACIFGLLVTVTALRGQSAPPPLPASPAPVAQPSTSIFTLPRDKGVGVAMPAPGQTAPPTPDEPEECFAPATGLYAPRPLLSAKLKEAQDRYTSLAVQNLGTMWARGMPRAANDPWLKRAKVVIRFAILADGNTDTPRITVSSGREAYDKHALDAIYKTPFAPLPDGIGSALPICMTFGYHMNEEQQWKKPIDLWPTKPAVPQP